jgi:asparagine synthase (glutamine-hydrolysing)
MMQYEVMKAARANGVTVLLDGQGGDETLLGYQRYYAAWLLDRLQRRGVRGLISAFRAAAATTPVRKLAMYLIGASSAMVRERAYRWSYGFLKNPRLPDALRRFARGARKADVMQMLEITETSLPMLLRFEDKNSMHFAIETRLPFLDYRLVEFGLALPIGVKLNKGWTKWPLRAAMQRDLPEEICWRKDKVGFAAPDQIWLNQHTNVMYEKVLANSLVGQFADLKALKKRFHRLDTGMRWRLYCLALWGERFRVEAV